MEDTIRLLILGTGSFAEEVADMASDLANVVLCGFVENMEKGRCEGGKMGLPVVWVEDLPRILDRHVAVCGLGTTQRSRFVEQVAALGVEFTTLVHPTARVSRRTTLGEGTIVSPGATIGSHSALGGHVLVNRGATIGHHSRIGDYVTIGPGVNISGHCDIGVCTYIGVGATIVDHITVGRGSVIAAGAVVTKDLADRVLAAGLPARVVKRDIEAR